MTELLWVMGLGIAWVALTANVTVTNLAVGAAVGYVILAFLERAVAVPRTLRKLRQLVEFTAFFSWELILANLRVAYDVVTPTHHMRPAVVALPLSARTDSEITVLANLITLTPGTLSLDISSDRRILYIHAMFVHDPARLVRDIKNGFERRLLEVMR